MDDGIHPFYFTTLVKNMNVHAEDRCANYYNYYRTPTVWFDGGYEVIRGASSVPEAKTAYEAAIVNCGNRAAPDIETTLTVSWAGDATMVIDVAVQNNDAASYFGTLRVFVCEIESSMGWTDCNGTPYPYPFLDYAFNEPIAMGAGAAWTGSVTWDGNLHDDGYGNTFGSITSDNIMVMAVVFNAEWHQGYSRPPDLNPFDAYYVDETVAAVPAIVVDSSEPECVVMSGNWHPISNAGAWGGSCYWSHPGTGSRQIGFRVDTRVTGAGFYEVFVRKFEHQYMHLMAPDAQHKIYHRGGQTWWIPVDLSTPGDEWISLGIYEFDSSFTQGVLINDAGSGVVVADAVKLVPGN